MPATFDLAESYTKIRRFNAMRDSDPLRWWHFAVPRLKEAFALLGQGLTELHARGPNKGTKTQTTAAFVMACLQKRLTLDGVPLPQWKGPVEAVQLVLDYPQQLLSVQAAYLKVLGDWPHHPQKDGEILKALRIKPVNGSSDQATWSVIHFLSQKNLTSGKGVRADIIAFDEPPVMSILQELRKAPHAGRRGIRIIAETPTKRREWAPLREDYGDTPRKSIRRVDRLRAEARWSLDEVADWVLSPMEKRDMWESYRGDVLFGEDGGARWHGDYMNTEGKCPLDVEMLMQLLEECRPPYLETCRIPIETETGAVKEGAKVQVEVFVPPDAVKQAYLDVDPASGIDDLHHNPAGILVVEMGSGNLLCRWNGYMAPFSVGCLAAQLSLQYHNAIIDIEMKDHWGVNVVRGVQYGRGQGMLAHEKRELRPGEWSKEVGFDNDEQVRAIIIGCIQEWLAARRAGVKYASCPSRSVIECLLDTELDERGKIVAGPGAAHGEDMVLWGQALRRAVRRSNREIPKFPKVITEDEVKRAANQQLVNMIRGGKNGAASARPARARVYRDRPSL